MDDFNLRLDEAKGLNVTLSIPQQPALNSYEEVGKTSGEVYQPEGEVLPPTDVPTNAPAGQGYDGKTGIVGGILAVLTLLLPTFAKMAEGSNIAELALFIRDLIMDLKWIFLIFGGLYLFREMLQGFVKQWTFGKVIDANADPTKNNIIIKPSEE